MRAENLDIRSFDSLLVRRRTTGQIFGESSKLRTSLSLWATMTSADLGDTTAGLV